MSFRDYVRTCAIAGAVVVIGAGCDEISTLGPDGTGDDALEFFQQMSLSEFESAVNEEDVARIEMVISGDLVARRIEIATRDEIDEPERIAARVVAMGDGYVVLDVGNLRIDLHGDATFRTRSGDEITAQEFAMRIDAALAEGHEPAVRVHRPSGGATSADDPAFVATHVDLLAELDGSHLALNLSRTNWIRNESPPPDGWIAALGLRIEVRVSDGTTTVGREGPDAHDETEFEGAVESVNVEEGVVVLAGGTRVRVVDQTRIKTGDGLLGSLEDVAEVLREGRTVVTWGEAKVERENPRVLVALVIAFKARHETMPVEDFEGVIRAIDLETSTIALENGIIVRLTADTHVKDHEEFLGSLEAAAEALGNGYTVVAFGEGVVEGREPLQVVALHIAFLIRHEFEDFEAAVEMVNVGEGTVHLAGGIVVHLTDETLIKERDGYLMTLEAVAAALEEDITVVAFGEGRVEGREPLTIAAIHVGFVPRIPIEDFEGVVDSVDPETGQVIIGDLLVLVTVETVIKDGEGKLPSLAAAAEAIADGKTVVAFGEGPVEAGEFTTIRANHIGFVIREDSDPGTVFEGLVASVSPDEHIVVLADGTTLVFTENSSIKDDSAYESLAGVAEALGNQVTIDVVGEALIETEGPPAVLVVLHAKFRIVS